MINKQRLTNRTIQIITNHIHYTIQVNQSFLSYFGLIGEIIHYSY